jgi:phosphohistidine phosphatase SixA
VGWTVGIFADQMARDLADPRLALTDPTGHLMVIGHLSDLAAWSTDLATQVTMIQVRLEEARQPQQSREVPRDE